MIHIIHNSRLFFYDWAFFYISAWIRHEEKRPSHGESSRGFHPNFFDGDLNGLHLGNDWI